MVENLEAAVLFVEPSGDRSLENFDGELSEHEQVMKYPPGATGDMASLLHSFPWV